MGGAVGVCNFILTVSMFFNVFVGVWIIKVSSVQFATVAIMKAILGISMNRRRFQF